MTKANRMVIFVEGIFMSLLALMTQLIFFRPFGELRAILIVGFVFVIWYAFRRGVLAGSLSGLFTGVLIGLGTPWLLDKPIEWTVVMILAVEGLTMGIAGGFARNLQRTLNNRRMFSVYLNLITGTILAMIADFVVAFLGDQFLVGRADAFTRAGIRFSISTPIILVILIVGLFVRKQWFIPKNTTYLSRHERSHLLND